MPYEYLEHEADMGIKAIGKTYEEVFEQGAKAMFNLMVDIRQVEKKEQVNIYAEASAMPELFVDWLNQLLAQKDISGLIFGDFKINKIISTDGTYKLEGIAYGEKMDVNKFEVKTEVKAATYSGLECGHNDEGYFCQCVLDI